MKKILFSLAAFACSMSMNAQIMKVMKNGEVVATYKGADYRVIFEEAPVVTDPAALQEGDAIALMDGTNHSKYTYVSGDGNTLSSFALADGQTAVSGANIFALSPYAQGSVSRPVTKEEAVAAVGGNRYLERELDYWKDDYEHCSDYEKSEFLDRRHVTEELNDENVPDENKAIVYAYIKSENCTFPGVAIDGNTIKNVVIPAEQIVAGDQTIDPKAAIKVAKADGDDLVFADVCAYVKVTPQFDCLAIALTSKGGEQLAGKVTIDYNDGEPTTTFTADGTNAVYLVGDIASGNSYYIAVRPETLASGYTVEFITADKGTYYAQSTADALALERGEVNLGEFSATSSWTMSSPTRGNDGAGHEWMLFTPTLKMSVPDAMPEMVEYKDVPSWGADWTLPSAAEYKELYTSGVISSNGGKPVFKGMGILKYVNVVEWNSPAIIWTSTPDPNRDNYQMALWTYNGDIQGCNLSSTWSTSSYIFKYTK